MDDQSLSISVNGQTVSFGLAMNDRLIRAVIISLFTWCRAHDDDDLPSNQRFGWWGDAYPQVPNDKIGSRLWLLTRVKLLPSTPGLAKGYAEEALQWMIDDGVASRIDCAAERLGMEGLALSATIYRNDSTHPVSLRFADIWEALKYV